MSKLTRYILTKICAKLVRQGLSHKWNITEYYQIMDAAIRKEFTEDNDPTREAFKMECFWNTNDQDLITKVLTHKSK